MSAHECLDELEEVDSKMEDVRRGDPGDVGGEGEIARRAGRQVL